jgi:hypothetical protein
MHRMENTPCTADGIRHAQVFKIGAVPYVMPAARRPPGFIRSVPHWPIHRRDTDQRSRNHRTLQVPRHATDMAMFRRGRLVLGANIKVHSLISAVNSKLTRSPRSTDTHADKYPSNDEHGNVLTRSLQDGSEYSEQGCVHHSIFPSDPICDLAIEETRDGTAQPDGRSVESECGGCETEVVGV